MQSALKLLVLLPLVAYGQWVSTRIGADDWTCTDQNGVRISGHARQDTAFVACSNLTLQDGKTRYVQGGKYAITRSSSSSAASSAASSSAPSTGTAVLTWTAPTKNDDGTPMTPTGYAIYYGPSVTQLTRVAVPASPLTYTLTLPKTLTYFQMATITAAGESTLRTVYATATP